MKLYFIILFLSSRLLLAQNIQANNFKELLVIDITNNKNTYEILTVENKIDTIRILSRKEKIDDKCRYDKIKVGKTYKFNLNAIPSKYDNLVVRVENEVFWKSGDKITDFPYFAENVKDKYVENNMKK